VEAARESLSRLINCDPREIVFVRNTTEAINLVGYSLFYPQNGVVLTTDKEHNSNLCIWKELERRGVVEHWVIPSKPDNTFNMEEYKRAFLRAKKEKKRVALVAICHTSNLDGTTVPLKEIVRVAHTESSLVLVDGAQSVPHRRVNVKELDVDFLAFSVHKMMGPSGMGVLYGKYHLLKERLDLFIVGGDTILNTYLDKPPRYRKPPAKYEAGLQNYAGMIGSGAAAEYLMRVGTEFVEERERRLNELLTELLSPLVKKGLITLIGPEDPALRGGIYAFVPHHPLLLDLEYFLNEENIMVRAGQFCVNSWFNSRDEFRNKIALRASTYLYNTEEEVRRFAEGVKRTADWIGKREVSPENGLYLSLEERGFPLRYRMESPDLVASITDCAGVVRETFVFYAKGTPAKLNELSYQPLHCATSTEVVLHRLCEWGEGKPLQELVSVPIEELGLPPTPILLEKLFVVQHLIVSRLRPAREV